MPKKSQNSAIKKSGIKPFHPVLIGTVMSAIVFTAVVAGHFVLPLIHVAENGTEKPQEQPLPPPKDPSTGDPEQPETPETCVTYQFLGDYFELQLGQYTSLYYHVMINLEQVGEKRIITGGGYDTYSMETSDDSFETWFGGTWKAIDEDQKIYKLFLSYQTEENFGQKEYILRITTGATFDLTCPIESGRTLKMSLNEGETVTSEQLVQNHLFTPQLPAAEEVLAVFSDGNGHKIYLLEKDKIVKLYTSNKGSFYQIMTGKWSVEEDEETLDRSLTVDGITVRREEEGYTFAKDGYVYTPSDSDGTTNESIDQLLKNE